MKQLPSPLRIIALVLPLTFLTNQAAAQQVPIITGPTAPVEVPEGDDFACNVLKNCWDMNEVRDIAFEHYVRDVQVINGVWTGLRDWAQGPYIPPELEPDLAAKLFPLYSELPSGNATSVGNTPGLPFSGLDYPIDTSRYSYLSMRMNHSTRNLIGISWNTSEPAEAEPDSFLFEIDALFLGETYLFNSGFHVYQFDLSNVEQNYAEASGSWSGLVNTLSIQPAAFGNSNDDVVQMDWIRLVDPNSAPMHTVSWEFLQGNFQTIGRLMIDTNNSGYNGTPIATFTIEDPQTYTFPTAMLPPGDYYFYVEYEEIDFGTDTSTLAGPKVRSGYSPLLRINASPKVSFKSPTQISGPEYAQTVRGDAWDMAAEGDIANLNFMLWPEDEVRRFRAGEIRNTTEAEEGGAVFSAVTNTPFEEEPDSDSDSGSPTLEPSGIATSVVMLQTNPLKPIDPKQYRYLTYRMRAIGGDSQYQRLSEGWYSNFGFGNLLAFDKYEEPGGVVIDKQTRDKITEDLNSLVGTTNSNPVYEGWHTYTIDLWDQNSIEAGPSWTSMQKISQVLMGPLQTKPGTRFEIDWVKLNAENRPINNKFEVELLLTDSDSNSLNVSLYYDTDSLGFDGTLISEFNNVSPGALNYTWDTSALTPNQEYYLYAVISDGSSTTSSYAAVPVRASSYQAAEPSTAPALDYDGDGSSDTVVYRPYEGRYYQRRSGSGLVSIQWVLGDEFQPIQGDFDGDGRTDLGLVFEFFGYRAWYIHNSGDNTVTARIWGYPEDQIAIADYNGDGKDQIGVFRDGIWFVLDENGGVHVHYWGESGDIAVPRDYNGDGIDDLAVWRPENGTWYVVHSGAPAGTPSTVVITQWGLPGDIPVPAEWSVVPDGRADYGVYRPSMGMWFFRDSKTDLTSYYQWGLPGHVPVVGDFDGDGYNDLTAFEEPTGNWYHYLRSRNTAIQQTGLPGDRIPLNNR